MLFSKVSFPFYLTCWMTSTLYADHQPELKLMSFVHGGNGCPTGSAQMSINPEGEAQLEFDEFYVESFSGVPRTEKRKFCQFSMNLAITPGWQYAIDAVSARGYASLDSGVTGRFRIAHYFQAQTQEPEVNLNLQGPVDEEFQVHDGLGNSSSVWSPCDNQRALNVKTSLSLQGQGDGYMVIDDNSQGNGTVHLKFKYRRCSNEY